MPLRDADALRLRHMIRLFHKRLVLLRLHGIVAQLPYRVVVKRGLDIVCAVEYVFSPYLRFDVIGFFMVYACRTQYIGDFVDLSFLSIVGILYPYPKISKIARLRYL